jgi:hypothetical protein
MVPNHVRLLYWWHLRVIANDPDRQAGFLRDWAGACLSALLYLRCVMVSRRARAKRRQLEDLICVHPNAAGLDIGRETIVAAVPADRDEQAVRAFATFTPDLHALVAWLLACGITTVAMESTGVYWVAIYDLLEQAGITCYLVNAQHVKTVPGRKSDWLTPGLVSARCRNPLVAHPRPPSGRTDPPSRRIFCTCSKSSS